MEMLIALAMVAVTAAVLTRTPKDEKPKPSNPVPSYRELTDICTLLQNIEVYDGTSKGQKKIGGDMR